MFGKVISAAILGIESRMVTVEADASDGLPGFSMVGYLASEVREAQDRVRTAIRNSGYHLQAQKTTVNLAPADMRKEGSGFDLPIAIAVLTAFGFIPISETESILFAGELSLNGRLNAIRGVLEIVSNARSYGCSTCIIPAENLKEGSAIRDVKVLGARTLKDVVDYLVAGKELLQIKEEDREQDFSGEEDENTLAEDFADLQGQTGLRRAAEVAVAGFHNLLIIGPPGSGKTMTARRIPGIFPRMGREEALEISKIHSIAGTLPDGDILKERPFRSPHHTITAPALVGGGRQVRPGEVSLAHRGVLYLDELPEFDKSTLEILRQPIEDGKVTISRNSGNYVFPTDFMLVASMNPCKCGYFGTRRCSCSMRDVRRYLDHISQPLLDRIDICMEAEPVKFEDLLSEQKEESSAQIRERVCIAQRIQQERYKDTPFRFNSDLNTPAVKKYCTLGREEEELIREAFEKLNLTARSYTRILKVARTAADLEGTEKISLTHLSEAIRYRALDKKYWTGR